MILYEYGRVHAQYTNLRTGQSVQEGEREDQYVRGRGASRTL
jgi:hypothetical protein